MRKKPLVVKYIRTSIGMTKHRGATCPVVFCDVCKKVIMRHGNVLWRTRSSKRSPGKPILKLLYTHKGCWAHHIRPKEEAMGKRYSSMELDAYLGLLLKNSRITAKKAMKSAAHSAACAP